MLKQEPIAGGPVRPESVTAPAQAIRVRIARKDFRSASGEPVPVLRDLSFDIPAGAITALIGPSGCGKTTTLRIMQGLDRDYEGAIEPDLGAERIGVVFQEPRLLPWRTVERNVRLALGGEADEPALDRLLAAVGLADLRDRYPAELSLGQARRVAIARAFAIRPSVLLLDEPFVSVDEQTSERLRALLLDLWRATSLTVLIVTHDIRDAVLLGDHVVLLSPRPATVVRRVSIAIAREHRHGASADRLVARLRRDLQP